MATLPPLSGKELNNSQSTDTSSPYAHRRQSKESVFKERKSDKEGGSRPSSRAGGVPADSFDGGMSPNRSASPSLNKSGGSTKVNISLYSSTNDPIRGEEDLDRIVVRNTNVKGKKVEYYGSEQSILNMAVKTAVLDNEELLESVQEQQLERCINMRQALFQGNEKRRAALKEFDDGSKWTEPSGFDVPHLVEQLQLKVSLQSINELGKPLHIPSLYQLTPMLNELLGGKLHRSRMEMIENEIRDLSDNLSSGRLSVIDGIFRLHELVHTDVLEYVTKMLQGLEPKLHQMMREVDASERERDAALKTDNIPVAQERHLKSVELCEDLMAVIRQRLNEVMLGSNDPDNFRSAFDQFQDDIMGSMAQFKLEKEQLREDIQQDIKTIKEGADGQKKAHEDAMNTAAEWSHNSNIRLGDNARKQDEVWAKVIDMVSDLKKLGEERHREVRLHIEMHEKETKRKYEYEEFVVAYQKHLKNLEEVLKHAEAGLRMTQAIDEYFSQGIDTVKERKVDTILDDLKLTEQKRYYEVYRKYVLIAGDLLDRKEKRHNNLLRLVRQMQFQKSMASETLDRDAEHYAAELKRNVEKADDVGKLVARLQSNMERVTTDFKATEILLEEQGVEFLPPTLELQGQQLDRRQKFLEARKEYLNEEQNEIDRDQTDIRKLNSRTKVEQDAVTQRRSERKKGPSQKVGPGVQSPSAASAASLDASASMSATQ